MTGVELLGGVSLGAGWGTRMTVPFQFSVIRGMSGRLGFPGARGAERDDCRGLGWWVWFWLVGNVYWPQGGILSSFVTTGRMHRPEDSIFIAARHRSLLRGPPSRSMFPCIRLLARSKSVPVPCHPCSPLAVDVPLRRRLLAAGIM